MRNVSWSLGVLVAVGMFTGGCATEVDDELAVLDAPLTGQTCGNERGETPPARGAICYEGFWSDGNRCDSPRDCVTPGTECNERLRHCVYVRPVRPDDPYMCPEGWAGPGVQILCAPGYHIEERGRCQRCVEDDQVCDPVARCRNAGLELNECLRIVAGDRLEEFLRLCGAAGLTDLECYERLVCGGAAGGGGDECDPRAERCPEPVDPTDPDPRPEPEPEPTDPARPADADPADADGAEPARR